MNNVVQFKPRKKPKAPTKYMEFKDADLKRLAVVLVNRIQIVEQYIAATTIPDTKTTLEKDNVETERLLRRIHHVIQR